MKYSDLRDLLSILLYLLAAVVGEPFRRLGTARRLSGKDVLSAVNMAASGRATQLDVAGGKASDDCGFMDYVSSAP